MKIRIVQAGLSLAMLLLLATVCAQAQLKAHVDLTRDGHRLKDASQAVVWLTPLSASVQPPTSSSPRIGV